MTYTRQRRVSFLILSSLLLMTLLMACTFTAMASSETATTATELPLTEGYALIASQDADMNGDGNIDTVFLEANIVDDDSTFRESIHLRMFDGKTKTTVDFSDEISGYSVTLDILSFGDKTLAMVNASTGGSGGSVIVYIVDFSGDTPICLFGEDESMGTPLESAIYKDNYLAELTFKFGEKTYTHTIDLSGNKETYQNPDFLVYDSEGKLQMEVEPFIDPISLVAPSPYLTDEIQLECYQRISGVYHADAIAELVTFLSYVDGQFVVVGAEVSVPLFYTEP